VLVTLFTAEPAPATTPETVPARFLTTLPPVLTVPETVLVADLTTEATEPEDPDVGVALWLADPVEDGLFAEVFAALEVVLLEVVLLAVPAASEAALVPVPVTVDTTPEAVPAAWETVEVAAPAVVVTRPVAPETVPDRAETRDPPVPAGACVLADAGPARSAPIPKARHRPPTTDPKAYNSTFRASLHQPFMPGTLIT
jgi:hypothetical protein